MTLTIHVPPELERALAERAQQSGLSVDEFAAAFLGQVVRISPEIPADRLAEIATRLTALERIVAHDTRARAGLPPLSDEDISRESIY
jgi:hypothetical protein